MIEKTMLTLLAVLAIGMLTIPAYAASPGSPLAQYQSGVPLEMIQCINDKVLMESPVGKPVCLTEDTAAKLADRGFTKVISLINDVDFEEEFSQTETLTFTSLTSGTSNDKVGGLGLSKPCVEPIIELELPNRINVDEVFNVTATFSFESYDEEYYDKYCFDKTLNIRYPPNYQVLNGTFISSFEFANTDYVPPIITHGAHYLDPQYIQEPITSQIPLGFKTPQYWSDLQYNQEPITFQMKISEPLEDQYDFGSLGAHTNVGNTRVVVYTNISDGIVRFAHEAFVTGQSEQNIPQLASLYYLANARHIEHGQTGDGEIPFDWIAEALEGDFEGHDPSEFIKRFGLDDNYVQEFLDIYPKFKTQSFNPVLSWILPYVYSQSTPNLSFVNGNVVFTNSQNQQVPVYGLNVTALDAPQFVSNAEYIYNGMTLVSDITDKQGNFRLIIPLMDVQNDGTTPDLLLQAIFTTEDFQIIKFNINNVGIKTSQIPVEHTITDIDIMDDISGPIFNYGTFELPVSQHSSRASYILNSLQPVNDWYENELNYKPKQSIIHWTPLTCIVVGVHFNSNVMDLQELDGINETAPTCINTVYSALENPHTLRHEYAHQVQNQIFQDIGTTISLSDCAQNNDRIHSPVHNSGQFCAFIEGWAFFMATAFDQNPVYQPYYMLGQWNFETRTHNEVSDSRFAGKSFVSGNQEGNVAAALYDIVDSTNEDGDDLQNGLSEIWTTFQQRPVKTISAFEQNWNNNEFFSLDQIFNLNTIRVDPTLTITPSNNGDSCVSGQICNLIDNGGGPTNPPTTNTPPVIVVAAIPSGLSSGETITLDASASTGSAPLSYQWRQLSSNAPDARITDITLPTITFTIPYSTEQKTVQYEFQLFVRNSINGLVRNVLIDVTLMPVPPIIIPPRPITPGIAETIILDEQFADFTDWRRDNSWSIESPMDPLPADTNNKVANFEDRCSGICKLEIKYEVEVYQYTGVELNFWLWFGGDIIDDDSLTIQVAEVGIRTPEEFMGKRIIEVSSSQYERWFPVSINLDEFMRDDFFFRILPMIDDKDAIVQIDGLQIIAQQVDNVAPVFRNVSDDIQVETSTQGGAIIQYTPPTALDRISGVQPVFCDMPSGINYPVGTTVITCTTQDPAGNQASVSFDVIVTYVEPEDTTPPVFSNIPDTIREDNIPFVGTIIQYTLPTATDNVDQSVDVICTPPSGTNFSVGTTRVTCIATDDSGNQVTETFAVILSKIPTTRAEFLYPDNPAQFVYPDVESVQGKLDFFPYDVIQNTTVSILFSDIISHADPSSLTYDIALTHPRWDTHDSQPYGWDVQITNDSLQITAPDISNQDRYFILYVNDPVHSLKIGYFHITSISTLN